MIRLPITSAILSLGLGVAPVLAQDFVDAKVQELFDQGYTHFSVERGTFRSEIKAYGANLGQLEVTLSNNDGSVVSQHSGLHDDGTVSRSIARIENHSRVTGVVSRNDREDDDETHAETHTSSESHSSSSHETENESDHTSGHSESGHESSHSESDHDVGHSESDHESGHGESDHDSGFGESDHDGGHSESDHDGEHGDDD